MKITALATGFGPLTAALVPQAAPAIGKVEDTLNKVVGIVGSAEVMLATSPGPDRAKAAGPLVAQVILASEAVAGRKVKDEAKFNAACAALAGDVADLLNSLEG